MSVKQISVFLENKPGKLCAMTEVLAREQIDMRALSLAETKDFGIVRIIVDDVYKATTVLKDEGYVHSVTSVMLDPTNSNIPVTIDDITSVAVNGRDLGFDGYLDIGLYDTMADLFVNFIGAVVFSTIGYFYIKHRGRGKIARAFIPTITGEASPSTEPPEAPDAPRE